MKKLTIFSLICFFAVSGIGLAKEPCGMGELKMPHGKSNNIIAYSTGDVDLIRTFGENSGKEIAERYEERVKDRELMPRPTIVMPEQERNMYRAEGEQLERKKKYKRLIELEKRWLKEKLKRLKEKYRTASGPPPKGYSGFNEKEYYKGLIESTEKKIKELEKDPEYYFYEKNR